MIEWWSNLNCFWQIVSIWLTGVSFTASYIWCRDPAFNGDDAWKSALWPFFAAVYILLLPALPCILFKKFKAKYCNWRTNELLISELEEENARLKTQLEKRNRKKRGK